MQSFLIKRTIYVAIVMLCISFIVFMILHLSPGDPVRLLLGDTATEEQMQAMRAELGFDRPIMIQYFSWLGGLFVGDWGTSLFYHRNVFDLILPALKNTGILSGMALFIALLIAIPLGVLAGVKRGSLIDVGTMGFVLLGQSCSPTWLGILLVLVFSVKLNWFPSFGDGTFMHIVLPALTVGTPTAAIICRMVRAGMIDTLEDDFISVARAKGEPDFSVVFKYALKNVLIPTITVTGLQMGTFLSGAVVAESIFAYNGIGRLMVDSVNRRDYPLVMGCLLMSALLFVLVNFLVDILYMIADPRIRFTLIGDKKRKKQYANLNE